MTEVRLTGVHKAFGRTQVLQDIHLHIRDGEFMVFVGPSGCGKSTLLRTIAGLEDITGGELRIGERVVNAVPPAERGIAMVFQSYALYPHMNLRENMAFGLELARMPRAEIRSAVDRAAKVLHIDHLLDRLPKDLSGGQRQRVAIGRAIVRQPQVFLFDEPLSNLDAALRVKMRYEFAKLHRELKTTMVYVTHDQVEAMTLADRIAVLNAGRIEQVGSPLALYEHPCNLFVAGFIGSPKMNFLPATVDAAGAGGATLRLADGVRLQARVDAARLAPGRGVTVGVRPEHLRAARPEDGPGNRLATTVTFVERLGSSTQAYCRCDGLPEGESLTCELGPGAQVQEGAPLVLHVPEAAVHLFDDQGCALTRLAVPQSVPAAA